MDVFISYSSKEHDEAFLLNEILKRNNIKTWIAPDNIPGGSNYTREIPSAIRACKVFLLVLSEKSQQSIWVSAEVETAFKNEKFIIPFVIEKCPLKDEFDFLLSRSQRIEAYEKKSEALETLIKCIRSVLNISDTTIQGIDDPIGREVKMNTTYKSTTTTSSSSTSNSTSTTANTQRNANIPTRTINYKNGDKYEGGYLDNNLHGYGVYTWNSGDKYEGEYAYGKRNGKGVYTWASGIVYNGTYVEDRRTGKGTLTWPSGDTYNGEFFEDDQHGFGVYSWPNGASYAGNYSHGDRTGKGKYTWSDGTVYEGDFIKGVRTGHGKLVWASGTVYEGDFLDDKRSGYGKITWVDGNTYDGYFEEDKFSGFGKYTTANIIQEGTWKDNKFFEGNEISRTTGKRTAVYKNGKRTNL